MASLEDADVKGERARMQAMPLAGSSSGVECLGLRKEFTSRGHTKVAVADLWLGLEGGQVFGLLGPNGAGKTTLLSMLVSSLAPTAGKCHLGGVDAFASRRAAQDLLGFCPQSDALFPLLTARENLELYARLNGTPEAHIAPLTASALAALDLTRYAQAHAGTLSGGNKRRLSLAVALIASPLVAFLDEPSSGVDPVARRRMGSVLAAAKEGGRVIVLTTHLVEEAEALCGRVGILVRGRLACLGSPAYLKLLYGSGYKIELLLRGGGEGGAAAAVAAVVAALRQAADESIRVEVEVEGEAAGQQERRQEQRSHRVTLAASPRLRLSSAFRVLEEAKAGQGAALVEYGVAACALENVFLRFTKLQEEADERDAAAAAAALAR